MRRKWNARLFQCSERERKKEREKVGIFTCFSLENLFSTYISDTQKFSYEIRVSHFRVSFEFTSVIDNFFFFVGWNKYIQGVTEVSAKVDREIQGLDSVAFYTSVEIIFTISFPYSMNFKYFFYTIMDISNCYKFLLILILIKFDVSFRIIRREWNFQW